MIQSNILLTDVEILTVDDLMNVSTPTSTPVQSNILLSDIDVPVHDNLISTDLSLNTNSPSNNDILQIYETYDDIPVITPGDGSVFPSDINQLPKITTLSELLRYLSEVMIRFNSNPEYYLQGDFELLIKTLTNSLIYLYTQNQSIVDLEYVIHFMGIATTISDPLNEASVTNHKYPGMYILSQAGEYTNFGLTVTLEELKNSVIYAIPNIIDGVYLGYNKIDYNILVNTKLSEFENDENFIPEAPNDNKEYVRKNEAWSEIDRSQFGTVKSVNGELPDVNGNVEITLPINTFQNDIVVSLPGGKTLGKYESGQTIPSTGKTAEEVFNLIAVDAIPPTVTLINGSAPGIIPFNTTTPHSKVLNFTKTINSLGGVVSSVSLEWKRANETEWIVLSTNTTLTTYTHTYTDSALNTNSFNYRYIVNDNKGGTATATVNINITAYVAPTTNINETITKELGDISTIINGTITVNSVNCPILTRTLKVSTDNSNWVDINSPGSNTVNYTHNDVTYLNSSVLYYRLTLTDAKQTTNLAIGTITFVYKSALGYLTTLTGTDQSKLDTILGFGNTSLTNSKSRTITNITATGGTYTYYVYAASAGDLTSIIQDGAAPVIGAFTKQSDVSGTNSYGASVTYRIYKSNATNAFTNNTLTFN